jgi:hypothetical protein
MATNSKLVATLEAEAPTRRLAVLIDADNAQASVIEVLLAEIATLGEATVKRIYGDFTSPASASWKQVLQSLAIKPVQQFAYTTGKNATDSTLIIDAMDLLYTRRFDGFCLVTSDSDFTGLAMRLREEGLLVYGFGEQKTPEAFRKACHKFLFTEVLRPSPPPPPVAVVLADQRASSPPTPASPPTRKQLDGPPAPAPQPVPAPLAKLPVKLIRQALEQSSDDQGWSHLGTFGSILTKLRPDFDSRNFGYKKLSQLVRERRDLFALEEREVAGSSHRDIYVRPK